jgi:hypothetical protein
MNRCRLYKSRPSDNRTAEKIGGAFAFPVITEPGKYIVVEDGPRFSAGPEDRVFVFEVATRNQPRLYRAL